PQRVPHRLQGTAHGVPDVAGARHENLSSGDGSKMADIGLETVFADEHDGEAYPEAGKEVDVERVALAISDEENVIDLGQRHLKECLANFCAAGGLARVAQQAR